MFSESLLKKWKKLLSQKYGQKNLSKQEVFEVANNISGYFDLLTKFNHRENKYDANNRTNKSQ